MTLKQEIKSLEEKYSKSIDELNIYDWKCISEHKLSEKFIRKFKNEMDWDCISGYQKLSEKFIREFKYKVNWCHISSYQKLSEKFIREFKNKVNWFYISGYQKLSEKFIREFKNKVDWSYISLYQKVNLDQKEFPEFNKKRNDKSHKDNRTTEQKRKEMQNYAKKWNLKFENDYLYCFRLHDKHNRGYYNKTIVYDEKKLYLEKRCDLNKRNENSFGLGAWPKGNVPIRIHLDHWGTVVRCGKKIRCFGFEII